MEKKSKEEEKKPLWLLDVDGVLNAVSLGTPSSKVWPEWKHFKSGLGFGIWFAPELTKFIAETHMNGLAEVRWLTTWEEHANTHLITPMGLPRLELLARRGTPEPLIWWKFLLAKKHVPDGRPLIWTDDDISYAKSINEGGIADWLANRGPTLAIAPSMKTGLTKTHVDMIKEFIDQHS